MTQLIVKFDKLMVWHLTEQAGTLVQSAKIVNFCQQVRTWIDDGHEPSHLKIIFTKLLRCGKIRVEMGDESHKFEMTDARRIPDEGRATLIFDKVFVDSTTKS